MSQAEKAALPLVQAPARPWRAGLSWSWLGVAPFFLFALLFLILPTMFLVVGAFQDTRGNFTLQNIASLSHPTILSAYKISLQVSIASALGGAIVGALLAWAISLGKLPTVIRPMVVTFSGVASNFAGIPLAFAFIATLGRTGLVTWFLNTYLDINIYAAGFNLLSFWGLVITYMYFQIPLMVLILLPSLDGLKKEWREASETLGASRGQYWRHIGFPILWPGLLGSTLLLFANAFGAIATAYGLTGSSLNIVPILLYAQIRGDVLHNPNLGYALALGMIVITAISNITYIVLRRRSERWTR
jgi:putative spermidine/putrescine transport system permease protein